MDKIPEKPKPLKKFEIPKGSVNEPWVQDCPICLSVMVEPCALHCDHYFCFLCLKSHFMH